jgi:hypothetical protein
MEDANRGSRAILQKLRRSQKIRRQVKISIIMSVISQDPNLTIEEAPNFPPTRAAPPLPCSAELAFDTPQNHDCNG